MYENSRGVVASHARAKQWYAKASYKGHADAQYSLGFPLSFSPLLSLNDLPFVYRENVL